MLGIFRKQKKPIEVVDITNPTMQSMLGRYFIGHTDSFTFGGQNHAWGGLVNPANSGVNMFFDIFTISNFTTEPFSAEIWFNPRLPGKETTSLYVHPANLTIKPPPIPKVQVQFASQVIGSPTKGTNVFNRIVSPNSTLISDSSKGGIIMPPGGSFIIFLRSLRPFKYQSQLVFSWWEEKV